MPHVAVTHTRKKLSGHGVGRNNAVGPRRLTTFVLLAPVPVPCAAGVGISIPAVAILPALKPKALVVAENLCLRHQLLALQPRQPRLYLKTADWLFWVFASRWLRCWRNFSSS
jgi:hypothetical protein